MKGLICFSLAPCRDRRPFQRRRRARVGACDVQQPLAGGVGKAREERLATCAPSPALAPPMPPRPLTALPSTPADACARRAPWRGQCTSSPTSSACSFCPPCSRQGGSPSSPLRPRRWWARRARPSCRCRTRSRRRRAARHAPRAGVGPSGPLSTRSVNRYASSDDAWSTDGHTALTGYQPSRDAHDRHGFHPGLNPPPVHMYGLKATGRVLAEREAARRS